MPNMHSNFGSPQRLSEAFYLQLERDRVEREEKIAERAAAEREARAERSERAAAERAEREARFAMVLVASVALVVSSMVLARARS